MSTDKMRKQPPELLTSIRDAYTLAATPENADELDEIIVKHFLKTLAEVTMAIAARKTKQETGC